MYSRASISTFSEVSSFPSWELLIDEIKKGFVLGNKFFERDVLAPQTEKLNIQGYEFTGYLLAI